MMYSGFAKVEKVCAIPKDKTSTPNRRIDVRVSMAPNPDTCRSLCTLGQQSPLGYIEHHHQFIISDRRRRTWESELHCVGSDGKTNRVIAC